MSDFTPSFRPETPVGSRGDNIFTIIGNCHSIAKQLGWPRDWIDGFCKSVTATNSYAEALAAVEKHFSLTGGDEGED